MTVFIPISTCLPSYADPLETSVPLDQLGSNNVILRKKVSIQHPLPVQTCREAIARAEQHYATPTGLLTAIATVEAGRKDARTGEVTPWPWSVNADNTSLYFPTQTEAVAWVRQAQARGTTSIDVGCMQVNLFYHSQAFASVEEAFDPTRNTDYAAHFLVRLCLQSGRWEQATGLYHSHTPDLATEYRRQVASVFVRAVATEQKSLLTRLRLAWGATFSSQKSRNEPADKSLAVSAHHYDVLDTMQAGTTFTEPAELASARRMGVAPAVGQDDDRNTESFVRNAGSASARHSLASDVTAASSSCWKTQIGHSLGQEVAGG
jgi:hypothetical protein